MPRRDELLEKMLRKIANDDTLRLTIEKIGQSTMIFIKGVKEMVVEVHTPLDKVDGSLREAIITLYKEHVAKVKK